MEAAILSSESPKGLFNSLVGSGNVPSESGSASPFSTILQSQQAGAQNNSTHTATTEMSADAASPLLSGVQNFPSLQQLSIASSDGAVAAPWLTLQAQTEAEHEILGADDLQILESPVVVSWVDPALVTVDASAPEMKELPALISNLSIDTKQGDHLASASGRSAVEPTLFESSGGGGQAGQTFQSSGVVAGVESVESTIPISETATPAQVGVVSTTVGEEPDIITPVHTEQKAAGARVGADSAGDLDIEITKNTGPTLSTPATVVVPEKQGGSAEHLLRSEAIGASVDRSVQPAGEIEQQLGTAQLRSAAASGAAMSEADVTTAADALSAAKSAEGRDVSLDSTAGLRTAAGVSTEVKSSELKGTSGSGEGMELPEARVVGAASDRQRSAEVAATQVASTNANTNNTQSQINAAAVSGSDAMSTQVRTAMQPQAKKGDTAERVESSIATDGSEGYHWLDSGADTPVTSDSELPQGNRSFDAASGGMVGVNTAPTNNTAVRNDAAVESFSSVKQAVDVAQTSEAKSTGLVETANLEIETPVRDAQWSQAFAYRVQFMATQGIQRAQVQLNPTELGPMEITIDIVDDVAQVQITAEQAATKEAVEQAVPRLREMMAQSGFGETNVELSSTSDKSHASAGDAQLMQNASNSAGGEGSGSSDAQSNRAAEAKPIETLAANERPIRTVDGRLSFYV